MRYDGSAFLPITDTHIECATMNTVSLCDRGSPRDVLAALARRLGDLDLKDANPPPTDAALDLVRRLIVEVASDPCLPPPLVFLGADGKLALEWQQQQLGGLPAFATLAISPDGDACEEFVSRTLSGRPQSLLDRHTSGDESRAFLNTVRALIEGTI